MSNNNNDSNKDIDYSAYLDGLDENGNLPDTVPEFEDILSDSSYDDPQKTDRKNENKLKKWWKTRTKTQKTVLIAVLVVIVLLIAVFGLIWSKLSMIDTNDDFTGSDTALEDEIDVADMDSITDANGLHDYLKKWATNGGEKMSAKYVKNILLVGQDSTSNCTDTMMLISVNEKTNKITMVSFYRDSWTYIQPKGKSATFAKMNAAYSKGGSACLIETIENNYKIKIDDFVMVDYESFPKVIDALGGVDVNVEAYVAKYINATWQNWTRTGKKVTYTAGMNHLDGEKALMFCRVRKLDSDINRTERQRRVITAIMDSFKDANISQVNSAINALLPNIKTGMKKSKILGMAADAVSNGWLKYPIEQVTMPTDDTGKGGYVGSQWVWLVDYEGAAYQLQMALYGQSNIKLSDDRVSPINIKEGAQTSSATYSGSLNKTTTKKYTNTTGVTENPTESYTEEPATVAPNDEMTSAENTTGSNIETEPVDENTTKTWIEEVSSRFTR